jgi:hypothetical protein
MIRIATTTKMMIKIVTPVSSSDGVEIIPQAILAPAFPTPSPPEVRSSLPACITRVLPRM